MMDLFICTNTYIALRSAPTHKSEMVSQILFGERFSIIESSGRWLRIETFFDHYSGWVDSFHGGYSSWHDEGSGIITGQEIVCTREDGSLMRLFPGSELFGLNDDMSAFTIGQHTYRLKEAQASLLRPHASVMETALLFLNAPYLWGGRTPAGTDCSGLAQTVYKIHGIALPRDAAQQAEQGLTINFFSDANPGDMLFFSTDTDNISHTGILLDKKIIIHASGMVRRDRVDHQGIWREDAGIYTHRLRIIKRLI
jgi:hypothetical protein